MHSLLLILIGFIVGILNSLAIKWTIKKILGSKNIFIVFLSFFTRITIIAIVIYIFLNNDWKNAIFILVGLTISKIIFIINEKTKGIKK